MDITSDDPFEIEVLQRGKGMAYTFVENEFQWWSWRDMLAPFHDDVMVEVVGLGVSRITCEPIQDSYDHRRHYAAAKGEGPQLMGIARI